VIENAFGFLKNKWKTLRHFNSRVDKITKVIVAFCVLHNLYEIWNQLEPKHIISRNRKENLDGFGAHLLPTHREGKATKVEGKILRMAMYEQWVFDHPL